MRQSIFIGKCESTPELRRTQAGTAITTLTLAVNERKGESWETHRFRVTTFGFMAERMARQAQPGSEIVAICKPEAREYTGRDGRPRYSQDHTATWIRVCLADGTEAQDGTG